MDSILDRLQKIGERKRYDNEAGNASGICRVEEEEGKIYD
jgi:hypothetical protein